MQCSTGHGQAVSRTVLRDRTSCNIKSHVICDSSIYIDASYVSKIEIKGINTKSTIMTATITTILLMKDIHEPRLRALLIDLRYALALNLLNFPKWRLRKIR